MALALPGKIQIAGVIDQDDAEVIIDAGADMLGFPLGLKDGREDLSVTAAAKIVRDTAERITSVCITYHDTALQVGELCEHLGVSWVQLHGPIEVGEVEKLKAMNPGLGLIKSLVVKPGADQALLEQVSEFEPHVDSFITDTYDPATGRSGATGITHNWETSRKLVQATSRPVILAGGLTHLNVADAIRAVRPAAVDAHTGVERADGYKSRRLVTAFVKSALEAW